MAVVLGEAAESLPGYREGSGVDSEPGVETAFGAAVELASRHRSPRWKSRACHAAVASDEGTE